MRRLLAVALLTLLAAAPPSRNLHDFTAAMRMARLDTRSSTPVTIFAPSDAGFDALPEGIHRRLLRPESRDALSRVLRYHMVRGTWSMAALRQRIADEGGTVRLDTLEGEPLSLSLSLGALMLTDVNGNTARVEASDLHGSAGPVHRLGRVMIPRMDAEF